MNTAPAKTELVDLPAGTRLEGCLVEGREFPTTLDQEQRLLFREIPQERSAPAYPQRICVGFRLLGGIEPSAIEAALNQLIRRHAALRVRFAAASNVTPEQRQERLLSFMRSGVARGGLYRQTVTDVDAINVRIVEPSGRCGVGSTELSETLQQYLNEEFRRPIPDVEPPHLQAMLVRLGERDSILILFIDHLVADGLSMRVVRRSFRQLLLQTCMGKSISSEPVDGAFLTYAQSLDRKLRSGDFRDSLAFWRMQWSKYGGERIAPAHFPFVHLAAGQANPSFSAATVLMDGEAAKRARCCAKRCRVTLHTLFLAAFGILLGSITKKARFGIWTHFSNRSHAAHLNSVGWFAQTHLVGFETDRDQTARELLLNVQSGVLRASKHQAMPLAHLWAQLECYPRFGDARILMDFIPYETPCSETFGEVTLEDVALPDSSAPRLSSLGLYVRDMRESFSICVRYMDTLYPRPAIEQMLGNYRTLVETIARDECVRISELLPELETGMNARLATEAMAEFVVAGSERLPEISTAEGSASRKEMSACL